MKNFAICLLLFTVITSCEKLEEVTPLIPTSILDGKWELQSVDCFCFFPDDFDFSVHTIDFDGSRLTIENSSETFFVTEAGTYDFQVQNDTISINNSLEFIFEVKDSTLVMYNVDDPEISDDEITLTYTKSE